MCEREYFLTQTEFKAEDFVQNLLNAGAKSACDETSKAFSDNHKLPDFYHDRKFKRAQAFFHKHIFALFYTNILGLISVLAIPSIREILIRTRKSGCPMMAYRRYLETLLHMVVWYKGDFSHPKSKLWSSIEDVKKKHNIASKNGTTRITQLDMVLTQFGFMGFAIAQKQKVGLHNVSDKDLESLVHFWRVIGFIMGIEDRFNICRESLQETTEICKLLSGKVFKPAFEEKNKDFIRMSTYLLDGMWSMNPMFNSKVFLNVAYTYLRGDDNNNENETFLLDLSFFQKMYFYFLIFTIWTLQFHFVRQYHNHTQFLSLWLMKVCPFLAYYQFGYKNSHVRVFENEIN